MDDADAELLNLGGITNTVNVLPAAGAAAIDVRRKLLALAVWRRRNRSPR